MNTTPTNCPKCNGTMIVGFIPDNGHAGTVALSGWHEGLPQKSFWKGVKAPAGDTLPIRSFRCSDCGYLEFYADKSFQTE